MKVGSRRWWFENRATGEITVAQFPNWPLFALGVAWVVGLAAAEGSTLEEVARGAVTGLWIYWGADELIRGVNPWRRLLGSLVIVAQVLPMVI